MNQLSLTDHHHHHHQPASQNIYSTLSSTNHHHMIQPAANSSAQSASFRIKSHPEDNQGYPEERNMDYDPDDCYPDDDSPYEGLIQPPPPAHSHQQKMSHHLNGYNEGICPFLSSNLCFFSSKKGPSFQIISIEYCFLAAE